MEESSNSVYYTTIEENSRGLDTIPKEEKYGIYRETLYNIDPIVKKLKVKLHQINIVDVFRLNDDEVQVNWKVID